MIKCWIENNAIQSNIRDLLHDAVIPGSIPVLWFGDIDGYDKSETRVITVGINPSKHEFGYVSKRTFNFNPILRIPIGMSPTPPNFTSYSQAMSQYFKNNPLMNWFWPNEIALNACDSTYGGKVIPYNDAAISNIGLHIDIVSPLATKPWGRLSSSEKYALTQRFNNVFVKLVEVLDPDILIFPIKLSTYFPEFKGIPLSSKIVPLKSRTYSVNKVTGNIGGKNRIVIEGWNGSTPFPFAKKSDIYSAIRKL